MKSFSQRLSTTLLFLARMVAKAKVTISIGGSNVDYNGATRHIRLPSLPDDDVVARDLAIGMVLHESGHAAYSTMELYGGLPVKSYIRGLFNAIDDVQQERQVIRDWPGAGPALKATVAQLCKSGFFREVDPTKPAPVVHSYVLMHLRHVFLGQPCGHLAAHSRDAFTALFGVQKEVAFRDMLETQMSSVWSSQAALDLAKKVIAFFGNDQDDPDQGDSGDSGNGNDTDPGQDDAGSSDDGDDIDSGQDDAGTSDDGNETDPSQDDAGTSDDGNDTDPGQDDAGSSDDGDDIDAGQDDAGPGDGDDTDPGQDDAGTSDDGNDSGRDNADESDDGPARRTQSPFADGGDDLEEFDLGQILSGQLEEISQRTLDSAASTLEIPMAKDIEPGPFEELAETSVHSHALRGTLVNLIESSRKQPKSTGIHGNRFDRRKVWRYRLGDDKLRVKKQRRQDVSTAVWLMLDVSGSMTNLIELARRSMLAASLALEAIEGTRVGAACFPYPTGNRIGYYNGRHCVIPDGVGVMLTPGESVRKNASRFMVEATGDTPLAEALWWSGSQLLALPEPRRMLFVFTDGEPDEPEKAEYAMKTLESVGIEVYGMAIGTEAQEPVEALFKRNALVTDLRDLQKAMFAMLKNAYLGAA